MARLFCMRMPLAQALSIAGLLTLTLSVTSSTRAQTPGEAVTVVDPIDIPPEHDPLAHAWDIPGQRGGFYLRASTGIGVHNTRLGPASWESGASGVTANGFGSGYGLDLGGFVRPWLALHLDANIGVLWNGSLNHDYDIVGRDNGNARVVAYGLAPAVTFFSPRNFFFKPAFGVGFATVKQGGQSNTTDPGFYMHLVAGKDLYTDAHFSFGLQFEVAYMLLGDSQKQDEARVRQFLFGLSFGFNSI
ncbi:MAG: hypothetical protein JWN48_5254 [Myxococcaceae bacterium]|nr:hypothetical protein [Myxococcaceae bacterium]